MKRLREIIFVFPTNHRGEKQWYRTFAALLQGIPRCSNLVLRPAPQEALPLTAFRTANVIVPQIVLNTPAPIELVCGGLSILNTADSIEFEENQPYLEEEYLDIEDASTAGGVFSMTDLYFRLNGHLVDIDHTGVNIPVSLLNKTEWEELINRLSRITNLYRYPGENWPFIIPANEKEFHADIKQFSEIRTPKFEWVYDHYSSLPILQFALVTDLSRDDLEELFPAPYGYSIPGLEHIFRSVTIDSPWRESLLIRADLYYRRNEGRPTDWETGEWLVKEGGRISGAV